MATKFLVNNVVSGTIQHYAGESFDDVLQAAEITAISAVGGTFYATTAGLAAAAALATSMKLRGAPPEDLESVMVAALNADQQAASAGHDTVDATTAVNVTVVATNQSTVATNQSTVATNQSTTATNNSSTIAHHETLLAVAAAATSLGTLDENVASGSLTTQPGHPRTLDVTFDAGYGGGDITITGLGANGAAQVETYTATPGGTVSGTHAFASVNAGGLTNATPGGGGGDVATVKTGTKLAVTGSGTSTFFKLSVDGVAEAFSSTVGAEQVFIPTTAPNGTHNYEVWYTAGHNHTQNSHGHTQDTHTHVQDTHTHVQDTHNHTQTAHTHTLS